MKAQFALVVLLLVFSLFADSKLPNLPIPLPAGLDNFPDLTNLTGALEGNNAEGLARNLTNAYGQAQTAAQQLPSGNESAQQFQARMPTVSLEQFRDLIIIVVVLSYIFASGKIADFLRSSGRKITKREAIFAPLAYMLAASFGVLLYFSSGAWVPPQNTIVTLAFYLVALPLGIAIFLGAVALNAFFRGRLDSVRALDLSMRIMFAPIFDGLAGYWTALTAAGILLLISGITSYSSGLNPASMPLDFLILSCVAATYFLYRTLTARNNEARAGNAVTMLILVIPGILRIYFKELVCAVLKLLPIQLFSSCPLEQAGGEVTLALSVVATLIILIPLIPIVYALAVNLLRFLSLIELLLQHESPSKTKDSEEGQ